MIEEEKNKTEKNYTHEMKGSEKCFKKKISNKIIKKDKMWRRRSFVDMRHHKKFVA